MTVIDFAAARERLRPNHPLSLRAAEWRSMDDLPIFDDVFPIHEIFTPEQVHNLYGPEGRIV